MYIVAVHNMSGDSAQMAKGLAAILGVTAYEARPRVTVAGGGPAVVASFADAQQAEECVVALHVAGFDPLCIDSSVLENDQNRFITQRLSFTAEAVKLWDHSGAELSVNYADVLLLLRGAGIVSHVQSETTTTKKFAVGRALATGGLMMRKKVTTTTASVNSERQPFCHLYAQDLPAIVLRQDGVDYACLGSERKLSREANFTWICCELRRLCSTACWDERLQTKPVLAQVLGPVFDPEVDLDLAITLVAASRLAAGVAK
ncbi:MAG: hypothetical protein B6I36_08815 [Desulfobacteraceae bacterium 4572_35.1]|nr:MAG: hypothetical protein B6I36_08815 [Desulfobacteraceae bacterium 4572_35.1]